MKSILQPWVMTLGLRHQGVLLTAVRGCDMAPKESASKTLTRYYRSAILEAHCGDATKSKSFIEVPVSIEVFKAAEDAFFHEWDALPLHYVMHLAHAAEIVGYYMTPDSVIQVQEMGKTRCHLSTMVHPQHIQHAWHAFYLRVCKKLHMTPETKAELDARLNKDEDAFGRDQHE